MTMGLTDADRLNGVIPLIMLAEFDEHDPDRENVEVRSHEVRLNGMPAYHSTWMRDFIAQFMDNGEHAPALIRELRGYNAVAGPYSTSRGGKSLYVSIPKLKVLQEYEAEIRERQAKKGWAEE